MEMKNCVSVESSTHAPDLLGVTAANLVDSDGLDNISCDVTTTVSTVKIMPVSGGQLVSVPPPGLMCGGRGKFDFLLFLILKAEVLLK